MTEYKIKKYNRRNRQSLKKTAIIIGLWSVAFGLFLSGCALHKESQGQQQGSTAIEQINVPKLSKTSAIQTAEEVLGEMHFKIDKADIDSGYIRTRPLAGAQFFEFWRSDNAGSDNWLMSNLHTIRRTVEIEINQKDEQLNINCNVHVQRLSLPEPDSKSSGQTYRMFSRSKPSIQKLTLNPKMEKDMAWIDLDDDKQLGEEILKRIEQRIENNSINSPQQAIDDAQATGNKT